MMAQLLALEGFVATTVANGLEALEYLGKGDPPDIILLDLMMPEMDGFQFLEELRQHKSWRSIPVIVMTAKTLTAEDRQRLNGSVEKILQKGECTREEFLREVHDLVAASMRSRLANAKELSDAEDSASRG